MQNSSLITVSDHNGFSIDVEIPTQEKLKDIKLKLIELLSMLDYEKFNKNMDYSFYHEETLIDEEDTLFDANVWDGSILTVVLT